MGKPCLFKELEVYLERNVVVHILELAGRLFRRPGFTGRGRFALELGCSVTLVERP